jgi:two-component system, cell cycle sensor histidine kinase and response regulator CckA
LTKILIVDDNVQNLYMLDTILKTQSYVVSTAKNGQEALEFALKDPPDLIIADILMPIMDGFKLCQHWKAADKLKRAPFIFYTATYTDEKDERFALSLGADRFILKPQKPDVLIGIVDEVLEEFRNKNADSKEPSDTSVGTLQDYNEVLFRKLEKKVKDLEITIAERQAAEQALLASQELFRKVFESGAIGIAILNQDLQYLRINDEYSRMVGYSNEDLNDLTVKDITHPDHHIEDEEKFSSLKSGDVSVFTSEKRYLRKDGSTLWSLTKVSAICDPKGKPVSYLVFASDISEQKIMQAHERQALFQIEKNLEQLANLNDQIRNPLSVILASVMLENRSKCTDQIIDAVGSIDDIVKRLDQGYAESAKVRAFLERSNQITRRA